MNIAKEFNALNGMIVTRKDLEKLLEKAEKEKHTIISKRVIRVLEAFKDDTFLIELKNLVEPYGLNGVDTDDVTGLLGGLEFVPESDDIGLGKAVSPNDIYDMVTGRMIDLIKDANKGDYKRAWKEEGYLIPYNYTSKKAYRGINVVMLSPMFGLLDNPYFLTFNQIQEKGGKLKNGSHGHKVVYFSTFNKEYSDTEIEKINTVTKGDKLEKGDEKTIFFLKYYNVFNGADIEGIDFDLDNFSLQGKVVNNEVEAGENEKIEIAESIVKNYPKPQPEIRFAGSRAFYQPENDFLSMPDISKFKTSQDFYRTLFHELSHSTGHKSRLKRPFNNPFGTPEYAFEELIAEFGAVFLSAQAGIMYYTNKNHAGYLKGWNEVLLPNLENDNRFLMKASSQAQKASDFILQPDAKGDFLFMKANTKKAPVTKAKTVKKESQLSLFEGLAGKAKSKKDLNPPKTVVKTKSTKKQAVKTQSNYDDTISNQNLLKEIEFAIKEEGFKNTLKERIIHIDDLKSILDDYTFFYQGRYLSSKDINEVISIIISFGWKIDKRGQVKKGLNAPITHIKKVVEEKARVTRKVTRNENSLNKNQNIENKNTLAYKMANKPKDVPIFKIEETDIAIFLGEVERKNKESVVISLTGGQGSMKTRMCFQFMNALAQNYKVGHASIEEHPESNLYFDKAEQYLNAKALNNIEAPEIKTIAELENLIKKNDVIVIDSFTKMQEMHKGFEVDKDLRKKYNGKLFIVIFQQTTDGKMRGGSKSQFDADIVLFTEKKDDYRENYIYADKNRYQNKPLDGLKFNIFTKKLQGNTPEATAEPTEKRKLSFTVN